MKRHFCALDAHINLAGFNISATILAGYEEPHHRAIQMTTVVKTTNRFRVIEHNELERVLI